MAFVMLHRGTLIAVPPVETAVRCLAAHPDALEALGRRRRAIVGAPDTVGPAIEALAREDQAGEVMIVTITHDHAPRRRSYELIARAFGLARASRPA